MIKRELYLAKLRQLRDTNLIKIATGIRRSGKSTILQMFRQELIDNNVPKEATQFINFEDPSFYRPKDWRGIYEEIVSKLVPGAKNYIFLDEIQNIKDFERLADGLFVREDVDLYITGSNAYMLSGELATLLSGRYIEIKVTPLSFAEYWGFWSVQNPQLTKIEAFAQYLKYGAFPEVTNFLANGIESQVNDYLDAVYNTVIEKDIVARFNFTPNPVFDNVLRFALDSVGSLVSPNNMRNVCNNDRGDSAISLDRINNYLNAFTDCYVLDKVLRFDVKGKNLLKTLNKYYCVDTGLRNLLLGKKDADFGHILENVVYFELKCRSRSVYVGKNDEREVDFVVQNQNGETEYYQVAETILGEEVRERELSAFKNINDNNRKILLTMDAGESDFEGVKRVNAMEWLLENKNRDLI